jgi:glycosyltransferase involved in cell wall biosynthesis
VIPTPIVHVISSFRIGGAELMLCKLLAASDRARFPAHVVSLTEDGPVGERLRALGVGTTELGMSRGLPSPAAVVRLARILRRLDAVIVQTWMYHADLVGGLAARLAGIRGIVWGIRTSTLDPRTTRRATLWTRRACAALSRSVPATIVSCSQVAARHHRDLGYAADRLRIIPNGFETDRFRPDPDARARARSELGILSGTFVVGMAARHDPQKDHATLFRAFAQARASAPMHLVLCGAGVTANNPALAALVAEFGLGGQVSLLGPRDDVERVVAGWDAAALSSRYGEGFPNVVGEAMSAGVPCIATDVGDTRDLVGDTGIVVPAEDPAALCEAMVRLANEGTDARAARSVAARARIVRDFSIDAIARRFEDVYDDVARGKVMRG